MTKTERVLRLSGRYHRKDGVTEADFHNFSRYHAITYAKIHEKYGTLKYQIACSSSSAQALAENLNTPYRVNEHDLEIEYYFKDVANLHAVSADEEFRALHLEAKPYVRHDTATITLTWVETYLEDGKLVNVGADGESLYPSFTELSNMEASELFDIEASEQPVAKYHKE
ncbi:hypothetical protein GGR56DRAFT_676111 [Xylariaceae sp. FL0804]|nr:hypothetical protein GGR56DRAFT_676111 [Xylariaceae sp. FL0804]